MDIVNIVVSAGVEGPSVYINNYRVAGNKPWGGGRTLHSFKAKKSDIFDALKIAQILKEKDAEIERLREALEEVGSHVAGADWHYMSDKTLAVVDRTLEEKE